MLNQPQDCGAMEQVEMRDAGEEWQRGVAATALDGRSLAVRSPLNASLCAAIGSG